MSNGTSLTWGTLPGNKGNKKSDDLVFLNAKNLPKVFLPSNEIQDYESVYDEATKRSRPPVAGEKGKTQYLFYGLSIEGDKKVIKIYSCGQSVAKGIGSVQKSLQNLGMMSFVKVTSTGSGLNTEYSVEAEKVIDKPIPTDIWDKLAEEVKKLPTLQEMRDRLLGLKDSEKAPVAVTSSSSNVLDI